MYKYKYICLCTHSERDILIFDTYFRSVRGYTISMHVLSIFLCMNSLCMSVSFASKRSDYYFSHCLLCLHGLSFFSRPQTKPVPKRSSQSDFSANASTKCKADFLGSHNSKYLLVFKFHFTGPQPLKTLPPLRSKGRDTLFAIK